ncbi:MAG TPA: (5-formylfuran-3-yl)methyl phosphate synthase [Pirellulales bacterium]|nr:(5-formylfuran-3-yl)methyl phosphate synthase [Pirellulales bacterium]
MTRLLVSVRSVDESREALAAGVDLIDFKEPRRGSLGPVDASLAAEMVQAIAGRAPVSMACGELAHSSPSGRGWARAASPQFCLQPPAGVSYAKLGLAGCATRADWPRCWADWIAGLPPGAAPVAVAYADWNAAAAPPPDEVLRHAAALGCRAVLVDTFDKTGGDLLRYFSAADLSRFAGDVRERSMLSVFAGSLSWRSLPEVLDAAPDYVAVRGAVCSGSRDAALDAGLVRQWVERIRRAASG